MQFFLGLLIIPGSHGRDLSQPGHAQGTPWPEAPAWGSPGVSDTAGEGQNSAEARGPGQSLCWPKVPWEKALGTMPWDTPGSEGVGIAGNPSGLAPFLVSVALSVLCGACGAWAVLQCRREIINSCRRMTCPLGWTHFYEHDRNGKYCLVLGDGALQLCATGAKRKLHQNERGGLGWVVSPPPLWVLWAVPDKGDQNPFPAHPKAFLSWEGAFVLWAVQSLVIPWGPGHPLWGVAPAASLSEQDRAAWDNLHSDEERGEVCRALAGKM